MLSTPSTKSAGNDDAPAGFEARAAAALIPALLEECLLRFVSSPIARDVLAERHRAEITKISQAFAKLNDATLLNPPPGGWPHFADRTQADLHLIVHDLFRGIRREVGRRNLGACDRAAGARGRGSAAP